MSRALTIFNRDIIPVYTTNEGKQIVIGRELHRCLHSKYQYLDWFKKMCSYGFVEGQDYFPYIPSSETEGNEYKSIFSEKTEKIKNPEEQAKIGRWPSLPRPLPYFRYGEAHCHDPAYSRGLCNPSKAVGTGRTCAQPNGRPSARPTLCIAQTGRHGRTESGSPVRQQPPPFRSADDGTRDRPDGR